MSDIVGLNMSASENATINILVPGGHTEAKNGQNGQYKTTAKVAAVLRSECLLANFKI
jgi:hypothetical protein